MDKGVEHHGLPFAVPEGDDAEMGRLIVTWRYRGPAVVWEEIVGHEAQKQRCRELVEKLRRRPAELARLRLRVGAGLVISGPSGVGKSMLARALATALGRDVVVPPTAELNAETIRRLYAQLAKSESPVVVLLDEAEVLIGKGWQPGADPDGQRALLAALDGISRPDLGPITVAVTTTSVEQLEPAAVRPGRLAPRLVLEPPSPQDRHALLERAVAGLPVRGALDITTVVDRTATWTGAELASAVEEACSRSLADHTDALSQDLLLEVIAERYVIEDEHEEDEFVSERAAIHEAGHALYAYLTFPGGLVSVTLGPRHGQTRLAEHLDRSVVDAGRLQQMADIGLAGDAAELIYYGSRARGTGAADDKRRVTALLSEVLRTTKAYDPAALESGELSDRGSERMRAGWHAEVEALAAESHSRVVRFLTPHGNALRRFGELLREAPDQTLSGEVLEAAIESVRPGAVSDLYGEGSPSAEAEPAPPSEP